MKPYRNENQLLDESIAALRHKKLQQQEDLKGHYNIVVESLKPSNLINQGIADIADSLEIKEKLKSIIVSISGGYLSKKLIVRKSKSFFKNLLGDVVQIVITSYLASRQRPKPKE